MNAIGSLGSSCHNYQVFATSFISRLNTSSPLVEIAAKPRFHRAHNSLNRPQEPPPAGTFCSFDTASEAAQPTHLQDFWPTVHARVALDSEPGRRYFEGSRMNWAALSCCIEWPAPVLYIPPSFLTASCMFATAAPPSCVACPA